MLARGTASPGAGEFASIIDASDVVRMMKPRQGPKVGCPEEIVCRIGYVTGDELRLRGEWLAESGYGDYLLGLLDAREL